MEKCKTTNEFHWEMLQKQWITLRSTNSDAKWQKKFGFLLRIRGENVDSSIDLVCVLF